MRTEVRVISKQRNGRCDECAPVPRPMQITARAGYISITVDETEYLVKRYEIRDAIAAVMKKMLEDEGYTENADGK